MAYVKYGAERESLIRTALPRLQVRHVSAADQQAYPSHTISATAMKEKEKKNNVSLNHPCWYLRVDEIVATAKTFTISLSSEDAFHITALLQAISDQDTLTESITTTKQQRRSSLSIAQSQLKKDLPGSETQRCAQPWTVMVPEVLKKLRGHTDPASSPTASQHLTT
jgi:type I site-specific restriction endonuclease